VWYDNRLYKYTNNKHVYLYSFIFWWTGSMFLELKHGHLGSTSGYKLRKVHLYRYDLKFCIRVPSSITWGLGHKLSDCSCQFLAWLSIHTHDLCWENSTTLLCLYLFVYFEIVFLSSLETKLWFLVFTYKTKVSFKWVFLIICSRFFVMSLTSEVSFISFPNCTAGGCCWSGE